MVYADDQQNINHRRASKEEFIGSLNGSDPDNEFRRKRKRLTASRAAIVEALRREHYDTFTGTTLSLSLATIRSLNDGVAVAEGTYELSGVDLFLGLTTSVTGPFTFRLAKQNGRWMIEQAQVKRS